jgi:hypothetical protein
VNEQSRQAALPAAPQAYRDGVGRDRIVGEVRALSGGETSTGFLAL